MKFRLQSIPKIISAMAFIIRTAALLIGICLVFWSFSALLVLLTPPPVTPWDTQPLPANGALIRVSDGSDLFLRHWLPESPPRQVVLGLHGLGQHSGYHHRFGDQLADAGIAYYALDLRGNGLTRTPHGDIPSVDRLYDDLDELILILSNRYPQANVYVLGHSLGGAMAASWAAERTPAIDGLIILAPAMTAGAAPIPWHNYLKGPAAWLFFPHRPVLEIGADAYAPERLTQTVNLPEEVDFIAQDPMHLQKMSMQFALAANRFRQETIGLAPQIQVPTLTLVGDADPAQTGAEQFYQALTTADKAFVRIPSATHLLFHIQEMPLVVQEVCTWLQTH